MEISLSNGKKYWLVFSYKNTVTNKNKLSNVHSRNFLPDRRITTCMIFQDRIEIATASVSCHKEDKYIKKQGRKQSLTKALEILGLTREEKTEFWNQYFDYTTPSPTVTISLELYNKLISFNSYTSNGR